MLHRNFHQARLRLFGGIGVGHVKELLVAISKTATGDCPVQRMRRM